MRKYRIVLFCVLAVLALNFSLCAYGEQVTEEQQELPMFENREMPPEREMPEGEFPKGSGRMRGGPGGEMMFGGERPQTPEGQMPQIFQNNQSENTDSSLFSVANKYFTPIFSIVILIFAFAFVIFYKRKHY